MIISTEFLFLFSQDPAAHSTLAVLGYQVNVTGNVCIRYTVQYVSAVLLESAKQAIYDYF